MKALVAFLVVVLVMVGDFAVGQNLTAFYHMKKNGADSAKVLDLASIDDKTGNIFDALVGSSISAGNAVLPNARLNWKSVTFNSDKQSWYSGSNLNVSAFGASLASDDTARNFSQGLRYLTQEGSLVGVSILFQSYFSLSKNFVFVPYAEVSYQIKSFKVKQSTVYPQLVQPKLGIEIIIGEVFSAYAATNYTSSLVNDQGRVDMFNVPLADGSMVETKRDFWYHECGVKLFKDQKRAGQSWSDFLKGFYVDLSFIIANPETNYYLSRTGSSATSDRVYPVIRLGLDKKIGS